MYLIYLSILLYTAAADENEKEAVCINSIANNLVSILDVDKMNNTRLEELQEKLHNIDGYVIDKEQYAEMLINETLDKSLNETNFYKALIDEDEFRLLTGNEPKSLYLKLKEKMNRDDILKLVANKNQTGFLAASARRMDNDGKLEGFDDEAVVDEVVDKILGEVPTDNHKTNQSAVDSIYWDPQRELEDLRDFHDGRRIFRGERTSIRYYPFMVSIHVMGRFWCGGALYWHDLVLTSASCLQLMHNNRFYRENPKVLQVRVGSNHSRISGELVEALEVYFHPGYNPRNLRNNIAVIRLRYRLFFNYHRTPKIIQISHVPHTPAPTSEVLVMGWGVTKMSQRLSYEPIFLQRKFLPVYPNHFCKEIYGDKFITQTMFCAGTMTTGEGACDHDAGGPAVIAGQLVGIISFGPSVCGYPNAPTVFTLIGAFADWIEQVNETMPDYYRGRARTTPSTNPPAAVRVIIRDEGVTDKAVRPIESAQPGDKATPPGHFRAKPETEEEWSVDD